MPLIITFTRKKKLLDAPGGRKIHKGFIPSFGGIAIFIGFIASMLMWSSLEQLSSLRFVYVGILLIVFTGIRDDFLPMMARSKLIWQITAAATVVFFADIRLTSFHGLFWVEEIPIWVGYPLSIFTIIVITNAFNLIDGINGLAGTICIIVLTTFGIWFYLIEQQAYALLIAGLAGAVLAFLKYNYTPAQIFMGDTGSLLLGFIIAIIAIKFIEMNAALPFRHEYKFTGRVGFAIAAVIYPLFDTLRVFVLRILQKRSPFSPDKSHIHHLVLRLGFSHVKATLLLSVFNLLIIIITVLLRNYGNAVSLTAILIMCTVFGVVLDYRLAKAFPKKTPKNKIFN